MDLDGLLVFARVVQTGSFTQAAQDLGLPKSTVSRICAELDTEVDAFRNRRLDEMGFP